MSAIVSYYLGESRDDAGRSIEDVWAFDHHRLEEVHNYIQWLFPLRTPGVAPAPLLDEKTITAFRSRPELRERLLRSFDVMLDFYGLKREQDAVVLAASFPSRAGNWLTPYNHNFLRITRILTCLGALGLERWSLAFFRCLEGVHARHARVIGDSWGYWRDAVRPLIEG